MNRFAKTAIAAVAGFAAVAVPMSQANADHWRRHHHRNGDAVVAGIVGLAAGALIVDALTRPSPRVIYEEPRVVYRSRPATVYDYPAAPRRYYDPEVITYDEGLEPWSRDWFRYCSDRYRSFNPETGTYRGYDGRNHFCQAN